MEAGMYWPLRSHTPASKLLLWPVTLKTPIWNIFTPLFFQSLFVLTATWHHGSFNLSKPVFPFPLLVLKAHLNGSRRNKKQEWEALKMNEIVLLLNCESSIFHSVPAEPRQHLLLMFVPEQVCNKE